jgi:hypothetical protein
MISTIALILLGIVIGLVLGVWFLPPGWWGIEEPLLVDNERDDAVDPWQWQEQLMEISGQRMPSQPMLTKDSILYAALILEEVAR